MNRPDAMAIAKFVCDYVCAALETAGRHEEVVKEAIEPAMRALLDHAQGTPGSGECVCKLSPGALQRAADRMKCTLVAYGQNMLLDHRCPHHGERAQPDLWGRHKERELLVTPQQWLSLGVVRS